jgi:hypothetical protein
MPPPYIGRAAAALIIVITLLSSSLTDACSRGYRSSHAQLHCTRPQAHASHVTQSHVTFPAVALRPCSSSSSSFQLTASFAHQSTSPPAHAPKAAAFARAPSHLTALPCPSSSQPSAISHIPPLASRPVVACASRLKCRGAKTTMLCR